MVPHRSDPLAVAARRKPIGLGGLGGLFERLAALTGAAWIAFLAAGVGRRCRATLRRPADRVSSGQETRASVSASGPC
jgi:hypothetical protein